jgi:ATP-dependent Clp protease ATP-binding subunit ClpB
MNIESKTDKLTKLHELDALLPREIRGQGQVLPRIISTVKRGELNLTKPGRPRGSFLLLGPTGVGKTETVVVLTNQIFGAQKLFRFDMSEFQTQESLGLLLGAKLGETGHLGAVRERAAEGSILFDEAEKAHPRVLDILLQLLDAARITMATGQTLDFSGFYVWLTSNIGSAELMSLQHSNDATLERHVLSRAQQALRPEIHAKLNFWPGAVTGLIWTNPCCRSSCEKDFIRNSARVRCAMPWKNWWVMRRRKDCWPDTRLAAR